MRCSSRILEVAGFLRGFVEGCCGSWLRRCCGRIQGDHQRLKLFEKVGQAWISSAWVSQEVSADSLSTTCATFLDTASVGSAVCRCGHALPSQSRGGSPFTYTTSDRVLHGRGLLQGDLFADHTTFPELGLSLGQRDHWRPALLLSFGEHPGDSALASWRAAWHPTHQRGGCSREFSMAGASHLTCAACSGALGPSHWLRTELTEPKPDAENEHSNPNGTPWASLRDYAVVALGPGRLWHCGLPRPQAVVGPVSELHPSMTLWETYVRLHSRPHGHSGLRSRFGVGRDQMRSEFEEAECR